MSKADSGLEIGDGDIPNLEDFNHDNDTNDNADAGVLVEKLELYTVVLHKRVLYIAVLTAAF